MPFYQLFTPTLPDLSLSTTTVSLYSLGSNNSCILPPLDSTGIMVVIPSCSMLRTSSHPPASSTPPLRLYNDLNSQYHQPRQIIQYMTTPVIAHFLFRCILHFVLSGSSLGFPVYLFISASHGFRCVLRVNFRLGFIVVSISIIIIVHIF